MKDIAYDEFGWRAYLKYGNDVTTEYEYHPTRRWLKHIRTAASNGRVIQDMEYEFDAVGNILKTENTAARKTIVQTYGYDELDELVSASGTYEDRSMTAAPLVKTVYKQTFEYDIIGNMTKKTSSHTVVPGQSKRELNYTLEYGYAVRRPHTAVRIGEYGYEYDANGNVTAEIYGTKGSVENEAEDDDPQTGHMDYAFGDVHPEAPEIGTVVKAYVWDEENRMKEAVVGREHVYFGYDAGGERTVKWSEHGETVYLDRMYQAETSTHPVTYTKHIFVGDTRLVSRVGDEGGSYGGQDGEMYYYHADHLGSSNWITDNRGAEYEHLEYTPYGEAWVDEGRDSLNRIDHLFTGKELDDETGLYYFGARYLDPRTSRWMSSDPAMEKYLPVTPVDDEAKKHNENLPGMGGIFNPVNLNPYHYAGNNPVKYVDPDGKDFLYAIFRQTIEAVDELNSSGKSIITMNQEEIIKNLNKIVPSWKYDYTTKKIITNFEKMTIEKKGDQFKLTILLKQAVTADVSYSSAGKGKIKLNKTIEFSIKIISQNKNEVFYEFKQTDKSRRIQFLDERGNDKGILILNLNEQDTMTIRVYKKQNEYFLRSILILEVNLKDLL